MTDFQVGGPARYLHQKRGLRRMIATGGITALLFDPGLGKLIALDQRVETPRGTRRFGDLVVGDYVLGRDGCPTEVLGIYSPKPGQAYRLTFSDGAEVVCDEGHLWAVRNHYDISVGNPDRVMTLRQIIDSGLIKDCPGRRDSANAKWFVPWCEPLQYAERELLVAPYAMGSMLANGYLLTCYLTTDDSEVTQRVVEETGLPWAERTSRSSTARRWSFLGLREGMAAYGLQDRLSRTKFVPEDYLQGSVEQRKALLAGLVDCDGSVKPGRRAWYHTRSKALADGVVQLVRSLGGLASAKPHVRLDEDPTGETVDYNVQFWTPFNPFTLVRKARNYSPKSWRRAIVSAEPVEQVEMRCIKVDASDGLFVVEYGVVTHNTAVVIDYAGLLALKSPTGEVKVLVVCPLVAVDTWVIQMETWVSPQVSYWVEAIGGSLLHRAETMAARGGNLYPSPLTADRNAPTRKFVFHVGVNPRALHYEKSWAWAAGPTKIDQRKGPGAVPGPRIVMEIINIDTLTSRAAVGRRTMADVMVDAIRRYGPDLLVIDESHKIKSPTGNASRLLARAKFIPRRVLLTGTVMPHGPLDVFGQWRVLDPYAFGIKQPDGTTKAATFGAFKSQFAITGGWMGKEVIGYRNLDELQDIMAKNAVVARKAESLDLPPTTDVILPVLLSPAENKAYNEMKAQLATMLASGEMASSTNRLTQMMRLRQITSGHLPDDRGVNNVIGASKAKTIKSLVEDTLVGEKRIVIFALFSQEIALLTKLLKVKGTEVMVIQGSTPGAERISMRKRFGSDDPQRMVMIAQIRTMSLAVNELVTASHCIFASLSQQRDDYVQGRDRLDRIGQTKPVTYWHAIALGTIDEVVLKSHRDGTDLESAVLKHIRGAEQQ